MALLIIALAAVAIILKVFVFKSLWAWFAVPAFGLDPLTFAMAFGLSLLATVALGRMDAEKRTDEESVFVLTYGILTTLLIWLLGAVARGFI